MSPQRKKTDTRPATVKFDSKSVDTIDKIKVLTGCSTRVEVLRRSLYLMDIITEAAVKGDKIFIVNKNGDDKKEIIID